MIGLINKEREYRSQDQMKSQIPSIIIDYFIQNSFELQIILFQLSRFVLKGGS